MNRQLKRRLSAAFDPPQPIRKEAFFRSFPCPKATGCEFFLSQLGYIRKRFWVLSLLLFFGMTFFSTRLEQGSEVIGFISALLPLLTLLTLTELHKSRAFHMSELEDSCKFNLSKLILMRLSVLGLFHLVLLLGSLLLLQDRLQYGWLRSALYAVTPFLLCSYLSFWITNHLKAKETLSICGGVTLFISLSGFVLPLDPGLLYLAHYTAVWAAAFLVIAGLLIKEIYFLIREGTEQWNFA